MFADTSEQSLLESSTAQLLSSAHPAERLHDIGDGDCSEICGPYSATWATDADKRSELGFGYPIRQVACIGGTAETARNVISERLLGIPTELRNDPGPFRDVPRGPRADEASR